MKCRNERWQRQLFHDYHRRLGSALVIGTETVPLPATRHQLSQERMDTALSFYLFNSICFGKYLSIGKQSLHNWGQMSSEACARGKRNVFVVQREGTTTKGALALKPGALHRGLTLLHIRLYVTTYMDPCHLHHRGNKAKISLWRIRTVL